MICTYVIRHNTTGLYYIGCTDDFDRRKRSHMSMLNTGKHTNPLLQEAYNNCKNITWDITEYATIADAKIAEKQSIRENNRDPLIANFVYARPISESRRNNLSAAMIGRVFSEEHKQALVEAWTPERREAYRELARATKTGQFHTDETKQKISQAGIGKKRSLETRLKMAQSKKQDLTVIARLAKIQASRRMKVSYGEIVYDSIKHAATENQLNPQTVANRCNNSNFPEWSYV